MRFFRMLGDRATRVFAIVMVVGAIFGFGHFMTPNVNDAWARVVLEGVGSALVEAGVPEHMKMRVDEGTVQEVVLNGNTLFYSLFRTDKDVGTLLDYYENLYGSQKEDFVPNEEAMRAYLAQFPKDQRQSVQTQLETIGEVAGTRHVRWEQDGWGAFATIMTGKEGTNEWDEDIIERFKAYRKTGMVKDLGNPKIVVAFDEPSQGGSQYFTVWPGADFDHTKVRPEEGEDSPGADVEDIERPLHSTRLVTFGQEHGGVNYEILVYRGPGTLGTVEDHWLEAMQGEGWGLSDTFAAARERAEDPRHGLLFIKEDREAYVSLRRLDDGEVSSTVVVHSRG